MSSLKPSKESTFVCHFGSTKPYLPSLVRHFFKGFAAPGRQPIPAMPRHAVVVAKHSFSYPSGCWGLHVFGGSGLVKRCQNSEWCILGVFSGFFPTCQVRVVRFYVSCRSSFSSLLLLAFCRTSTTTIHAQCSLPDLNHDHPRPVFAAGPQPRPSMPSVRCRTSTTTIHAQCSLPDLNHDHPRTVFAAGPQPRPATPSVRCRTSTTTINAKCSLPDPNSYAKSYAR